MRPALCEDALRLGRILAERLPKEPEVHGLVALMEIQASRSRARVGPSGEIVLLLDQDRGRWDPLHISRGLAAVERAQRLGGALGPYALQAAIAACHARARSEGSDMRASTSSRPAAGPNAMPTATARLSSTTGDGMSSASAS